VIVKEVDVPVHVLETGVTVILAVIGTVSVFVEVNVAKLPVPVSDDKPILAVVLTQS
jgi:hypothetical protein